MKNQNFIEQVIAVVQLIPKGRVCSYGLIANYLGTGKSARMVGWALKHCVTIDDTPAHRVVNSVGLLTGKHAFETPDAMQLLLENEGVKVFNDKVVDFKNTLWDPNKEL